MVMPFSFYLLPEFPVPGYGAFGGGVSKADKRPSQVLPAHHAAFSEHNWKILHPMSLASALRFASLSMFSCATVSKSLPSSCATALTYDSTSPSLSANTSGSGSVPASKCSFNLLASSPPPPYNSSVAYVSPPMLPVSGYTAVPRDCFWYSFNVIIHLLCGFFPRRP